MRICIDATPLLLRSAGVKTYFHHWLENLRAVGGADEILAFPWLDAAGELNHEGSQLGRFGTLWRVALILGTNYGLLPGLLTASMPRADVFHVSNQNRRPPGRVPLTATVHDMTCWLMPELHTEGNIRADREFADRVLKKARGLIAVSENTRKDAARLLGFPQDRIATIHPGVADAYFEASAGDVPREFGVGKPYVLFVGTIEPRKNVGALLDAWCDLPAALRDEFRLVIAGPAGWNSAEVMNRLADSRSPAAYLGYVPEAKLPSLVAGATAVAYPSLYEGFGFPVAQAMACGVPVITSNVSSLPEVTGDGALLVDPRSPAEIRAAIERLLTDEKLRESAGAKGRAIAKARYRWPDSARKSLDFFRKVISS